MLQPTPDGLWGIPPDELKRLPGYDPDVKKNAQQARAIMERLGYGPSKRLKVKLSTRDLPQYRDPAIILLDQLKEIYIDGELEIVETGAYFPKMRRKGFVIALNLQTSGPDPDPILDLFYGWGSSLNWDDYWLFEEQSMEADYAGGGGRLFGGSSASSLKRPSGRSSPMLMERLVGTRTQRACRSSSTASSTVTVTFWVDK